MKDRTVLLLTVALVAWVLAFTLGAGHRTHELEQRVTVLEAVNAQQTATITAEADAITRLCKQIEGCVNR